MTSTTNTPELDNGQPGGGTVARRLYLAGSIGAIFVGGLHTFVHFTELNGDELKARFDQMGEIFVSGDNVASWDLFQAMSLLFGLFTLTLGVVSIFALLAARDRRPPLGICVANIAVLVCVVIVGVMYLGPRQVYGGIAGIVAFASPIVDRLRR